VSRYDDGAKERVREAADLLQVVGQRVELTRRGADSYFGRCPFHDERTPSFHVRPGEGYYHCFGCQQSGDVFTFVMETEGSSFVEALEMLADRFGVELEPVEEDPHVADRRARDKRLLTLLDRAATWYSRVLWDAPEAAPARAYLLDRGLDEGVLRDFRVGYAPEAWDRLVGVGRGAGFSDQDLLEAGLAKRRRDGAGLYDAFRERITFPLADERGRVRGFGARSMRDEQQPKYLNSPESDVFHKGRQLFGVDRARRPAAAAARVVLAEGYTDVIALHQAGVREAVGIMGTSLTEEQVGVLKRVAPTLLLALDADSAGQEAMLRAAELAGRRDLELRVVPLPSGRDPADLLLADGPERLRALAGRSAPFVVFRVEKILSGADTGTAEGRDQALAELRPILKTLRPSVQREELVSRIASVLQLSEALVATLPADAAPARALPVVDDPPAEGRPSRAEDSERAYLALCLALPGPGAESLRRLDVAEHFTGAVTRRAAEHLLTHLPDPFAGLQEDPEVGRLLSELSDRDMGPVNADSLEHAELILEQARLDGAIARARAVNSPEIFQLAGRQQEVRRRINAVSEKIGA
jgi:DNA primase